MECGICRQPFNREYFGDDPIAVEIFQNRSREEMVPRINNINLANNNNNNQNHNHNQNNHNARNLNNMNSNNNNILAYNQVQLNILSENTTNKLIAIYNPNKCICFIILILNIMISGLGTLMLSIRNCSLYDFALGLIQFFGSYFFFLEGLSIRKIHYIYYIRINSFLFLYLICLSILFYLSSIYVGIFHNFVYYNPRRTTMTENKEKGICIILLNLFTGGIGTILYGVLIKNMDCFNRAKVWMIGLVQICGFAIFILAFTTIGTINKMILTIFFFIGVMGYITSICIGMKCYQKISNS